MSRVRNQAFLSKIKKKCVKLSIFRINRHKDKFVIEIKYENFEPCHSCVFSTGPYLFFYEQKNM